MKDTILTFSFIVFSLAFAAILNIPLFIGFGIGLILVILLIYRKGFTTRDIILAGLDGLKRIRPVLIILALITLLIPSWIISGTVPTMISFIISWIEPSWILLFAFTITAITSFILGTAIGTLGSLGIIMIGVALAANVPVTLVAGALVSGAFVGDRCSPLSSAFHLAANSVDVEPKQLFRNMLPTTCLMILFCLIFYFLLGFTIDPTNEVGDGVVKELLQEGFQITLLALLPIIILFGSILLNIKTIPALSSGVLTGVVIALFIQGESFVNVFLSLAFGYNQAPVGLEEILKGGGLIAMWQLFIFITLASIMNGLLDRTEMFKQFMVIMFKKACTLTNYTIRTVFLAIIFAIVGCNQAFPVMLTGRSLKKTWISGGYNKADLGRVVCDSALVTSGLIPWNMVAILSAAAIGVATLDYAFFAAFLWVGPLATIIVSMIRSKQYKKHTNVRKIAT